MICCPELNAGITTVTTFILSSLPTCAGITVSSVPGVQLFTNTLHYEHYFMMASKEKIFAESLVIHQKLVAKQKI